MFRNHTPMPRRMNWQQQTPRAPQAFFRGGSGWPQQTPARGNQGLLSRLFQRQSASPSTTMFSRGAEQTSLLQSLANPQKINQFLSQTQQVLNTAQQFGPMIQQYGPVIKNLPAMWKLYQGFKSMSNEEETNNNNETNEVELDAPKLEDKNKDTELLNEVETNNEPIRKKDGESVPKLYIH